MNSAAQLIHEFVVLYDVAVGAGVDGRDRGLNSWYAGDQQKEGRRRDLLGKLEEIHAARAGHAYIRNDDVEDLGFELALGRLDAVRHFDAVTLLAKGNFQQFTDGFFVVDHENMRHLACGCFPDCGFCTLHNASPNSRQLDNKLSTAVFLGYDADLATVRLHNLINNGQSQPGPPLEIRLQRLKDLGLSFWVQANTGVLKGDAQPERALFQLDGQGAATGHGAQRIVTEIPKDLLDFVGVHARAQFLPIKGAHNVVLGAYFRLLFHQHQRFIQQAANIGILKFVGLLSRIVEKVRDDIVEPLGFPADDIDKMLFVFFERYEAR